MAPVPPSAIAMAVVSVEIVPPVIATAFAFCVAKVPRPRLVLAPEAVVEPVPPEVIANVVDNPPAVPDTLPVTLPVTSPVRAPLKVLAVIVLPAKLPDASRATMVLTTLVEEEDIPSSKSASKPEPSPSTVLILVKMSDAV